MSTVGIGPLDMGTDKYVFTLVAGPITVSAPADLRTGEERHLADFLEAIGSEYRAHAEQQKTSLDLIDMLGQHFGLQLTSGMATVELPRVCEEECQFAADFLSLVAKGYRRFADDSPPIKRSRGSRSITTINSKRAKSEPMEQSPGKSPTENKSFAELLA